ncbi:MBL fold metallo-hydrolase [Natronospirillum operosum]|uniref:MBL fold metallo-hydrolase n=1 Tax=Natronospirillum operosum TaxID=2759953 RepID=A0A4Z0W4I3_9GAMM|nr:MBL fold metallo-hydrolase [Natronospirillum operosum]TGG90248.1 MBL fold metallo-hydrolase [Natronospirillum operosum]
MIFRQLYDATSSTYTYLLADENTREALYIDPVFEQQQRDLALVEELGLTLKLVLDTHMHADHVTAAWALKQKTGAEIGSAAVNQAADVDHPLRHGDTIGVGAIQLEVRATPGHTGGCLTYVTQDHSMAFTGDAVLIRGCGRSDFQQGNAATLYHSITEQVFTLPDECRIYPAHDYNGRTRSTVGEEKAHNPRVGGGANEQDFVRYMNAMRLPHPKKIDEALPANLRSGKPEDGRLPPEPDWAPVRLTFAGVPEVEPDWVVEHRDQVTLLDVREPNEIAEPGEQLDNAVMIPVGELHDRVGEVPTDKPIVALCRSGRRSSMAVNILRQSGVERVANIRGGRLRWKEQGLG